MPTLFSVHTYPQQGGNVSDLSKSIELENDIHLSHDLIFFYFSKSLSIRNEIRPSNVTTILSAYAANTIVTAGAERRRLLPPEPFFDKTLSRFKMQKIKVRLAPYPGGREKERERVSPNWPKWDEQENGHHSSMIHKGNETNTGRFLRCVNGLIYLFPF